MYSSLTKRIAALMTIMALAVSAFSMLAPSAEAATACNFTRDLTLGVEGEDVRCLQKYLNSAGFTIASSGVGSAGNETNQFKEKTQAALIKWQTANGILPATGTFGPKSRAKYAALVGTTSNSGSSSTPSPAIPSSSSSVTIEARVALLAAISAYDEALDEDGDADDLEDAASLLHDAFVAFLNGNLSQAKSLANSSEDKSDASVDGDEDDDDDNSDGDESDAEDAIDELDEALNEAWDEFESAEEDGEDTGDAEDLLDEADELLNDAEDAFDDEDYEEVLDLTDEAMDLIDDAREEMGLGVDSDEQDAEDAIEDAEREYDDARDEVQAAEDDGEDTDEAYDLLDDADEEIEAAQDAFDDEDYDEALEHAEEALDLIEEALETL